MTINKCNPFAAYWTIREQTELMLQYLLIAFLKALKGSPDCEHLVSQNKGQYLTEERMKERLE